MFPPKTEREVVGDIITPPDRGLKSQVIVRLPGPDAAEHGDKDGGPAEGFVDPELFQFEGELGFFRGLKFEAEAKGLEIGQHLARVENERVLCRNLAKQAIKGNAGLAAKITSNNNLQAKSRQRRECSV